MSHYKQPAKERASVVIFYRNFAARSNNPSSHIGLGVNGLLTAKVLRKAGITCDVVGIWDATQITAYLDKNPTTTHAMIEAPFIGVQSQTDLLNRFPNTHFIVRAHSQIGFLQVEAGAIKLLRDLITLEEGSLNLSVASNARNLCRFVEQSYHAKILYLPNLYDHERAQRKTPGHQHHPLRIASFGALRLLKNHTTSAAGAMMAAKSMGRDLEFHVNSNREEHGGGVIDSLRNMFTGVRGQRLIEIPWEPWPTFRRTISHMDLCIQMSFTETHNIVSADAATEGVPSVVSSAIEWAPSYWQANADNADDVSRVAIHLLNAPHAAEDGIRALTRFSSESLGIWLRYLDSNPLHRQERY